MPAHKHSALYRYIERLQGEQPWGSLLDAGTGDSSLRWICELPTERWTAVTASARMVESARDAIGTIAREQDRIVHGNWADNSLLEGEVFNTVIADYLLGAIEGFVPYFQPLIKWKFSF